MSSVMNILYVIPYFSPVFGGEVNACYNMAQGMMARGHNVSIICSDYQFDEKFASSLKGAQIITFPCRINLNFFLYSPEMKKWLSNNIGNYDIVHLQTYRSYQSMIARRYCTNNNIPYILHAHGTVTRIFKKRGFKLIFDSIVGRRILGDASSVVALSNLEKEQYESMHVPPNKIQLIPNGVRELFVPTELHRGAFRKRYGITQDAIVLLFLGRLHKIKGLSFLINSLAMINDKCQCHLFVVGPDEGVLQELNELVNFTNMRQSIHFTGPLYGNDKISALLDADIYVQPSIYDAFPTSVLEASSSGLPVIVTESCGCSDMIAEAKAGLIVKYGDCPSLSNAILELAQNPHKGQILGTNGKKIIKSNYNINTLIDNLENLYIETSMVGNRLDDSSYH